MNKVLVTGAAGFIGSQVVRRLIDRGSEVHAISRTRTPDIGVRGVHWHPVDLLEQAAVDRLLDSVQPEGLIHLAWETQHGTYWNSPRNLDWLRASLALIQKFESLRGARLVVGGSSAEYHWDGGADLAELTSPTAPNSLYGTSKNALREVLSAWAPGVNLSWAWARFFNVFGPGEPPERLIPRTIRTLAQAGAMNFDSGVIERDFMHVDDVAAAVVALYYSEVRGPVNVASGEARTVKEVVLSIAACLSRQDQVHFDMSDTKAELQRRVIADTRKLRDEVRWTPQVGWEARLQETCAWWESALKNKQVNV
jgi:nucleoside-diphosphate-sugar epimerase